LRQASWASLSLFGKETFRHDFGVHVISQNKWTASLYACSFAAIEFSGKADEATVPPPDVRRALLILCTKKVKRVVAKRENSNSNNSAGSIMRRK
jgi:hypothetical protein